MVMIVTGPVSPDRLGVTLMHEHFTFAYPGWFADDTLSPYDQSLAEKVCLKVLEDVKKLGVNTIVDATAADVHCQLYRRQFLIEITCLLA